MTVTEFNEIETPALLLDTRRMMRNIQALERRLGKLGTVIRPHVKTCKNIEIGRRMMTGDSPGITVSTLAEAEAFFRHGIDDQIYAVGIAPGKLAHVAGLMGRGLGLKIILDNAETAARVVDAAGRLDCRFSVLLEIDSDGQRAGFDVGDPGLLTTAQLLDQAGCMVAGVITHMGAAYACRDAGALIEAAERERETAVTAARNLRTAGFECPIVSVGSTPTAWHAKSLDGVTEVRAGTHVFMDLVMAGLGVCTLDDIAITVLAEVIGFHRQRGEWLIDAGWMALSRDRGTAEQAVDQGYGLICDEAGRPMADTLVRSTNQEHGIVARRDGAPIGRDAFRVGQRLRILPNHACATAAQHSGYRLVGDGADGSAWWPRIQGW